MKRRAETRVGQCEAGQPLLDLLARRFAYHSREGWRALAAEGRILLDGIPADGSELLARGQTVTYLLPEVREPEVSFGFSVVHEDDSLLVVDKPGNLPCHPAGAFFNHTLWAALRREGRSDFHFVNRLDRETSGLVLIALDREAARECRRRFSRGEVVKRYRAVVHGRFPEDMEATGVLVPDRASEIRKKLRFAACADDGTADGLGGRVCRTRFKLLDTVPGGLSVIEATPLTGRTHQIRATLCSLGYPLVGDKLYGLDPSVYLRFIRREMTAADRVLLRLGRQALHASELVIPHPRTAREIRFTADLPADMGALCAVHSAGVP